MKLSDKNACDSLMKHDDHTHIRNVLKHWASVVVQKLAGHQAMAERLNYINTMYKDYELNTDPAPADVDVSSAQECDNDCYEEDSSLSFDMIVCRKYLNLSSSAKRRNKEFNLTISDIRNLLRRKTCYYTGVTFSETTGNARTIDRIDETKGYVKGNVVAVSEKANRIKNILFEDTSSPVLTTTKELGKMLSTLNKLKK